MIYEYHSVLCGGFEIIENVMREWGAAGWEIFAVTNGHWGMQIMPAGVTLWMRRPVKQPEGAESPSRKPAGERLAEIRRAKKTGSRDVPKSN